MRAAWTTPRAIRLHLTLLVLLSSFTLLARWQVARALGGNGLSWLYAFEWPLFGVYAIFIWWRLLHDDDPPRARRQTAKTAARDAQVDAERAEYNTYLALLHEEDEAKERKDA